MSEKLERFNRSQIEALSQVLGDGMTGSQISKLLAQCGIVDNSNQSTKWRRLDYVFCERQNTDQAPNAILNFVQEALQPVLFIKIPQEYEKFRVNVNQILLTSGIEIGNNGKLNFTTAATTITEVLQRTKSLERLLRQRNVHPDILKYCKEELLQENYFHAVFEAAKSLSDRVREMTSLQIDGYALFETSFKIENPYLALSKLSTTSEKNQQNGLRQMLCGITSMVRNVTAHESKIKWAINETDAVDILSTISFLHKQLDECIVVPRVQLP